MRERRISVGGGSGGSGSWAGVVSLVLTEPRSALSLPSAVAVPTRSATRRMCFIMLIGLLGSGVGRGRGTRGGGEREKRGESEGRGGRERRGGAGGGGALEVAPRESGEQEREGRRARGGGAGEARRRKSGGMVYCTMGGRSSLLVGVILNSRPPAARRQGGGGAAARLRLGLRASQFFVRAAAGTLVHVSAAASPCSLPQLVPHVRLLGLASSSPPSFPPFRQEPLLRTPRRAETPSAPRRRSPRCSSPFL